MIKSLSLGKKCLFKHKNLQMFDIKLYKYRLFSFRGSETQYKVGEILKYLIRRFKD